MEDIKKIVHVQCLKESAWGELHEYMKNQTATLQRIEKKQGQVLERIFGNGEGLVTSAALNKQAIKRIWWWLGAVSVAIIVAFVTTLFEGH